MRFLVGLSVLLVCMVGYFRYVSGWVETELLVAKVDSIDMGFVSPGVYEALFTLSNESGRKLKILHSVVSCDCLGCEISPKEIGHGQQVDVKCKWDARGLSGPSHTKIDVVYVDEVSGRVGTVELYINGNVEATVTVSPSHGSFTEGAPAALEFELIPASSIEHFKIVSAEVKHEGFAVSFPEVDGRRIRVDYSGAKIVSLSRSVLLGVKTSAKEFPSIEIPLFITRTPGGIQ
ncbi:MAG: DUF1573 domain-containing protein [Pirellulaceae bacterium]|nr:DUF1573 domain-containing protein [Pirellulaceae bacterium]